MRLHKISIFYLVAFFALLSSIGNFWAGKMETLCGDKIFQKGQCQLIGEINNIIKKIATCLLWVYSIAFAIIGTLGNLVASPKPMLALVSTVIMIVNIALLIVNYFLVLNENQHWIIITSDFNKKYKCSQQSQAGRSQICWAGYFSWQKYWNFLH